MTDTELRDFYRALAEGALAPEDSRYVPLYTGKPWDPVERLATTIEWAANDSAQLLSGFRGSGKSTELRRLQQRLRGVHQVVLCDMEDYLNLTTPVDVADFLLALAGALGDALAKGPLDGKHVAAESYWTRFRGWMTRTEVSLDEIGGDAAGASIKLSLKQDPTFRQELQKRMAGHLGRLVEDVRLYIRDCVRAVDDAHPGQPLVLLLDSVEHIRGTALNADDVSAALVNLFHGHADKLRIPHLHVIYTVPPWLKIREPGVAAGFDEAVQIPCVAVNGRGGEPAALGRGVLDAALAARGPWHTLASEADRDRIIAMSGGHFRELMRLCKTMLVQQRGRRVPVAPEIVGATIAAVRGQYLPISHADAKWLARIAESHTTDLPDGAKLPDLARFFDSLLVMTYNDGEEWWDVHPLIRDVVLEQARLPDPPSAPSA